MYLYVYHSITDLDTLDVTCNGEDTDSQVNFAEKICDRKKREKGVGRYDIFILCK